MKYPEIKKLSNEELKDRIKEEQSHLVKARFGHAVSALENPLKLRSIRKDIARLHTEWTRRENESMEKSANNQ